MKIATVFNYALIRSLNIIMKFETMFIAYSIFLDFKLLLICMRM